MEEKKLSPQEKYSKENIVPFLFKFNKKRDRFVIEKLQKEEKKTNYVRKLINDDIEKNNDSLLTVEKIKKEMEKALKALVDGEVIECSQMLVELSKEILDQANEEE